MKKLFSLILCLASITTFSFAAIEPKDEVNEKVLHAFKTNFPVAENVRWKEYADFYSVSFLMNNIQTEARYDKEGNFLSSLRYYKEETLPLSVLFHVKKKYPQRKIFGVTESLVGTEVTYYIVLEDEKTWLTVKSDDAGNLQVTQKLRKS